MSFLSKLLHGQPWSPAEVSPVEPLPQPTPLELARGHARAALDASGEADRAAEAMGDALKRRDAALRAMRANAPELCHFGNRPFHRQLIDAALASGGVSAFCSMVPTRGEKLDHSTRKLIASILGDSNDLR